MSVRRIAFAMCLMWSTAGSAGEGPAKAREAPSFKSPDEQMGWKEANWGSAPLASMECHPSGVSVLCDRTGDADKQAGEFTFQWVLYNYLHGQLYGVLLSTGDEQVCRALPDSLRAIYGPGEQGIAPGYVRWTGETVTVFYSRDHYSCAVLYTYEPIYQRIPAAERAAAAKRGAGL